LEKNLLHAMRGALPKTVDTEPIHPWRVQQVSQFNAQAPRCARPGLLVRMDQGCPVHLGQKGKTKNRSSCAGGQKSVEVPPCDGGIDALGRGEAALGRPLKSRMYQPQNDPTSVARSIDR